MGFHGRKRIRTWRCTSIKQRSDRDLEYFHLYCYSSRLRLFLHSTLRNGVEPALKSVDVTSTSCIARNTSSRACLHILAPYKTGIDSAQPLWRMYRDFNAIGSPNDKPRTSSRPVWPKKCAGSYAGGTPLMPLLLGPLQPRFDGQHCHPVKYTHCFFGAGHHQLCFSNTICRMSL
jgi:hypothetical protein